ncbi:MAG: hypothetical protein ACLP5H_10575 [Desulfomonilaceae bacterium]
MSADMVKCPHCFGDKPAEAKVCLHCGRDEHGFGPLVQSQAVTASDNGLLGRQRIRTDLRIHVILASILAAMGFLIMLSSGLGALLFVFGIVWLVATRVRIWWRQQQ